MCDTKSKSIEKERFLFFLMSPTSLGTIAVFGDRDGKERWEHRISEVRQKEIIQGEIDRLKDKK